MAEETANNEDMRIDPQRATQLFENLVTVRQRVQSANKTGRNVRLIAVSKLKPATDILALHQSPNPHSHFGENYAQELTQKASLLPRTINWHFMGALQSNKCKPLAEQIPNLWCVSSVDSVKKADGLEKGRRALLERQASERKDGSEGVLNGEKEDGRLRVQVQVNTSGEESKSGVEPADTAGLVRHIREQCPNLRVSGLMTIGAIARSQAMTPETENEDFVVLKRVRDEVVKELGLQEEELELSMGMSADFEGAIGMGSDEVRVGTGIFGERPPKKDAHVKGETSAEKG
ncbi:MAG: hypothetical protein M1820_006606 [Bogoriella megaspora]|nr:MAG: hypothetical protein M1820_006606 [Bogoriella megaspora]